MTGKKPDPCVGGVVLCGGRSSRMGRPKALLEVGRETAIQRVVNVLQQVVSPIVVVKAPGQELPELPSGVTVVEDAEQYLGPLAGMARGLEALSDAVDAAYVTACDVPLLTPEFVQAVIGQLENADCAVPKDEGFFHPLAGVYRTHLAEIARGLVEQGKLRPLFLIESCEAKAIPVELLRAPDPELGSLRNINTPEDYQAVLELIEKSQGAE